MTVAGVALVLFRQDLRLEDNVALLEAAKSPVCYAAYFDPEAPSTPSASRLWLYHSICLLKESLNGKLSYFDPDALDSFLESIGQHRITTVHWAKRYGTDGMRDAALALKLKELGVSVCEHPGTLLFSTNHLLNKSERPYQVFTPFWKNALKHVNLVGQAVPAPDLSALKKMKRMGNVSQAFSFRNEAWARKLALNITAGEVNAKKKLSAFLRSKVDAYKQMRDTLSCDAGSGLSASLHFGEISVRAVFQRARRCKETEGRDTFLSQLGWREFCYHQLSEMPDMSWENKNKRYDHFPWRHDKRLIARWKQGETGIPVIDAAMKQLYETGTMHNRSRMLVASFLVKNLMQDWREGYQWFMACLFDADEANNAAGWQWVAGCGADAAPFFRIFNPVTQGKRFDADGVYVKRHLPDLVVSDAKYLHTPWEDPINSGYPEPMVSLSESRAHALSVYREIMRKSIKK